jgi:hypothetical protein
MTSRMRHLIAPALLLLALALPAAVQASPDAVVRDCAEDGSIDGKYSDADKRAALKKIPADLDEYSDCRAAINGAIGTGPKAGSSGKKGGSGGGAAASSNGGGGGGSPTIDADTNGDGKVTDAEKAAAGKTDLALKQDKKRKNTESSLGDPKTDPTKVGAIDASQTSNGVSAPVIASIAALALLAAVAAVFFLGRRKPGFAQAMRRVPVPGFLRR